MEEKIPIRIRLLFASGMAGWSILTNLILVLGPYFYLPPQKSGLSPLIPQIAWFGVVNLMSLIFSAGRITDAFLDPLIARWSDNNRSRFGRRIPFLRGFFIPASFFAVLVFFPPVGQVSEINAWWLTLVLILFYVSATAYVIPMNALIPEIARTTPGKISISLYQQAGFVVGVIISALSNNIAAGLEASGLAADYNSSLKFSAVLLGFAGAFLMGLPAFLLKEPLREKTEHVTPGLFRSLKETLAIRNFRFYLLADFSFYTSLSLISSGLLYYVTVLAGLEKEKGGVLMGVMVISSLIFYPVISKFGKRLGYKFWIISGLFILSGVFCLIFFLGTLPVSGLSQMIFLALLAAYPLAALGVIPTALLAEIAHNDGGNREALFFAVKFFVVKLGQTLGVALFAVLTLWGIDPGDDLGLRLGGIAGAGLCLMAAFAFFRFQEKSIHPGSGR